MDAAQGIEAQTLANTYLAFEHDLEIVPVINKTDLPGARPDEVKREIEDIIGIDGENAPLISAKNGVNIEEVLEKIVELVPPPGGDESKPLKALIFDSYYDAYKGVIVYVRVMDGSLISIFFLLFFRLEPVILPINLSSKNSVPFWEYAHFHTLFD